MTGPAREKELRWVGKPVPRMRGLLKVTRKPVPIFAVPTTAVLKVIVGHAIERYKESNLYLSKDIKKADASDTSGA